MLNKFKLLPCFVLALALAGCLVPEKFVASISMKSDGSYTYKYDGSAVHALAAAEIKQSGALSSKDDVAFKKEAEKTSKAKGVRKFSYLGAGRFDLSVERDMQIGQMMDVIKVVSVTKDKSGVITIAPDNLTPKDEKELAGLGIKVDGTVEVRLPSNAQVISQNATATPGLFSKAYSWKIGALDQRPSIKFKLVN